VVHGGRLKTRIEIWWGRIEKVLLSTAGVLLIWLLLQIAGCI
jgi:hypothetical protein